MASTDSDMGGTARPATASRKTPARKPTAFESALPKLARFASAIEIVVRDHDIERTALYRAHKADCFTPKYDRAITRLQRSENAAIAGAAVAAGFRSTKDARQAVAELGEFLAYC